MKRMLGRSGVAPLWAACVLAVEAAAAIVTIAAIAIRFRMKIVDTSTSYGDVAYQYMRERRRMEIRSWVNAPAGGADRIIPEEYRRAPVFIRFTRKL
jgi:hypothetical protein